MQPSAQTHTHTFYCSTMGRIVFNQNHVLGRYSGGYHETPAWYSPVPSLGHTLTNNPPPFTSHTHTNSHRQHTLSSSSQSLVVGKPLPQLEARINSLICRRFSSFTIRTLSFHDPLRGGHSNPERCCSEKGLKMCLCVCVCVCVSPTSGEPLSAYQDPGRLLLLCVWPARAPG